MFEESETIELKQELTKNIKKEIIALANSKGGTIYIGVNDDGNAVGLDNINTDIEALSGMIREGIISDLTMYTNIEREIINEKEIIKLTVYSGPNKPYYLADKGVKSGGVFIRHGSSSIPASDEVIRQMLRDTSSTTYETDISANQNLTFNYIAQKFKERNILFNPQKYRTLKMITDDSKFNNLSLLISDQNPFTIKCGIFDGLTKTNFKDQREFTGSSIKQLDDAYNFFNFVNRISGRIVGLQRIDKKDYPDFALREALANALMHRSYYFNGSVLLSIFDDRIEINSMGGLLSTLTLDDIKSGFSESRNPNFAEVFHRLEYVENYGTGIGRIMDEYKDEDKKPIIELSENVFKIIIPNRNYHLKDSKDTVFNLDIKDVIKNYLIENGSITRLEVEKLLNVSNTRAKQVLRELVNGKIIIKKGNGRDIFYTLK